MDKETGVYTLRRVWLFCDPADCSPPRLLCPWNSPGKNTGVGYCAPYTGSSRLRDRACVSRLLQWQAGSLPLGPPGGTALKVSRVLLTTSNFQSFLDLLLGFIWCVHKGIQILLHCFLIFLLNHIFLCNNWWLYFNVLGFLWESYTFYSISIH